MNDGQTLPKSLTEAAAALPDAPPEDFPRAFGNYMLLAPLARGGMGEVFLAKHGSVRGLEKHCVVKTLRPHLTDDREYTSRFIDEARIVVQLGHRNICHVFDVGTVGERYYLAMEYIAGKDLRALGHDVGNETVSGTRGVVSPGLALHIVCEVLEALDYAHRHKDAATGKPLLLVHRDVSPQNVMLSWEGEVKLIDFGLAASTLKMEQTSPNVVMGKLAYMAPEQVRGERVDGRADLFAAGVVLYEMLVGERFYEGRSPYEIWGLAAQGNFRPRAWDALDSDMKDILDKALAGQPTARYATCLELREALQSYRYARALHGDAPMLRSLMQQVYAKEIEDSRQNLVALSQARPSHPQAGGPRDPLAAHPSGVFSVSTEPTLSIARSPSSSMPVKEGTEPTEMVVKAMFGPRRYPIAAAALVLIVVAAAAFGVWWTTHNTPAVAHPPPKPPPAPIVMEKPTPPVVVAPVVAVDPPVAKPADKTAPKEKPAVKPAEKPALPVAAVPDKPVEPVVEVKPGDIKPGDGKPGDVKPADAKPDAKTGDEKPAAKVDFWKQRVDVLSARCPEKACTQSVAEHRVGYAAMAPDKMFAWKEAVKACEVECGVTPEH